MFYSTTSLATSLYYFQISLALFSLNWIAGFYISNPTATTKSLMKILPGPMNVRTSNSHERTVGVYAMAGLMEDISSTCPEISFRLQWRSHPTFSVILVSAKHAFMLVHMARRTVFNIPDLHEVRAFEPNQEYKDFPASEKMQLVSQNQRKQE